MVQSYGKLGLGQCQQNNDNNNNQISLLVYVYIQIQQCTVSTTFEYLKIKFLKQNSRKGSSSGINFVNFKW